MPTKVDKALVRAPLPGRLGNLAKLIVEHGIPRFLVAAGIATLFSFLVKDPSSDWRTNLAILAVALSAIVLGVLTRIFEMKYGIFSGRITLMRCRNCGEAITSGAVAPTNKPPQFVHCNHCQAISIIQ